MHVKTLISPPFSPITLAEAYEHLRWDTELAGSPAQTFYPLETLITRSIATATEYVEAAIGRSLVERTLQVILPKFPGADTQYRRFHVDWDTYEHGGIWIELPGPPVISVSAVEYYDSANILTTIDASNYFVVDRDVPRLQFITGYSTPSVYLRGDAVKVTYQAGYAPTASPPSTQEEYAEHVPQRLKDAVLITLQLLVDRFDASEREALERTREWLLSDYVIHSVR